MNSEYCKFGLYIARVLTIIDQHGLLMSKSLKTIINDIIIGFDNIKSKRKRWIYSFDFNSKIIELKTWMVSVDDI